nr:hypothetical protein [Nonomuraea jabiensis]
MGDHCVSGRFIGQAQAELAIDLGLVLRVRSAKCPAYVSDRGHHLGYLLFGESFRDLAHHLVQAHLLDLPLRLRLGDPAGDHSRIAPRIDEGAVGGQLSLTLGHGLADGFEFCQAVVVGELGAGHRADRVRQVCGIEDRGQPLIQRLDYQLLSHIDGAWVVYLVGLRVLAGENAAVVRLAVVPAALHTPLTDAAEQQPPEDVRTRSPARLTSLLGASRSRQQRLNLSEGLVLHQRLMSRLLGPDPVVRVIPAKLGHVAEGDVVDVDEHLILALPVPDLPTGVARIEQDRSDRRFRPGDPAAMAVSGLVVGRGAQDAVAGDPFCDGE